MEPQYGNSGFLCEWGSSACSHVFLKALSSNDSTAIIKKLGKRERDPLASPYSFMNLKFDLTPQYSYLERCPRPDPLELDFIS